jgi:hypothetical protein
MQTRVDTDWRISCIQNITEMMYSCAWRTPSRLVSKWSNSWAMDSVSSLHGHPSLSGYTIYTRGVSQVFLLPVRIDTASVWRISQGGCVCRYRSVRSAAAKERSSCSGMPGCTPTCIPPCKNTIRCASYRNELSMYTINRPDPACPEAYPSL